MCIKFRDLEMKYEDNPNPDRRQSVRSHADAMQKPSERRANAMRAASEAGLRSRNPMIRRFSQRQKNKLARGADMTVDAQDAWMLRQARITRNDPPR